MNKKNCQKSNTANSNSPFYLLPHPEILPRMLVHQNIPLLYGGDVGVDFCNVNGTVTKHFLDVTDVYISI